MKVTSIEVEGKPGCFATLQRGERDGKTTVDVICTVPTIRGAGHVSEVSVSAESREELWDLAKALHSQIDGATPENPGPLHSGFYISKWRDLIELLVRKEGV